MSRDVYRVAAIGCTAAAVVLLLLPARDVAPVTGGGWDKGWHIAGFAGLGFLWRRAGLRVSRCVLVAVLLAAGTEFLQGRMQLGRTAELADAVADVAGVAAGLAAFGLVRHRSRAST